MREIGDRALGGARGRGLTFCLPGRVPMYQDNDLHAHMCNWRGYQCM